MLYLLSWIVTGLIVGFLARAALPGRQNLGVLMTIVLGVVGACVGGLIFVRLLADLGNDPDVNRMWPGWLMAVLGGVLVLWLYTAFVARRNPDLSGR